MKKTLVFAAFLTASLMAHAESMTMHLSSDLATTGMMLPAGDYTISPVSGNSSVLLVKGSGLHAFVFGRVIAMDYVIEWQKRGLPHMHIMIWLAPSDKLRTTTDYDTLVSAEIPPEGGSPQNQRLRALVIAHMLHGPCAVNGQMRDAGALGTHNDQNLFCM